MSVADCSKLDLIREFRLRQWARQHFVPPASRRPTWHPIVLNEMQLRDVELNRESAAAAGSNPAPLSADDVNDFVDDLPIGGTIFVPLAPSADWRIDSPAAFIPKPHLPMGLDGQQLPGDAVMFQSTE